MPSEDYDWIQLASNEWLKGHITSMKQYSLEFESDKLKDLTIDWEDVRTLHTSQASCLFGNDQVVVGAVTVDPKFVTVLNKQSQQFPRSELVAIAPGVGSERDYWSGDLMLGATYRTGNTNQTELTAQSDLKRRTPESSLAVEFLGNYGNVDGIESSNNDRLTITYDRSITRQFFVRPVLLQYYHDSLQNIAHQATFSAGAGYYFFDEPNLLWQVFAGPAYQYTRFEQTENDGTSDNATPAFAFQTRFEKDLTQRLDLQFAYQGILTSKDAGLFTHHAVGTLEFKVTHVLNLDLSLIWDRSELTSKGASGTSPKKDDFQTVMSVGFKF